MLQRKNVFLCIAVGVFAASCSNTDLLSTDDSLPNDEVVIPGVGNSLSTDKEVNLSITSPVATTISIFKDMSCAPESKVVVNMPVSKEKTTFAVMLPNDCSTVYVVYPIAGGEMGTLPISVNKTSSAVRAENTVGVELPETAVASTVSGDKLNTYYHSSGTVMFDDGWPTVTSEDADFNNLVIDYDLETAVASVKKEAFQLPVNPNNFNNHYYDMVGYIPLTTELKVVMHVRAVGSKLPSKAGVVLEGLTSSLVTNSQVTVTLGNYGEVPAGSLAATVNTSGKNPVITIENLQWLLSDAAKNYTYQKNEGSHETFTVNNKNAEFYNTERDCINSGGDLFTITAIFNGQKGTNKEFTGTYVGDFTNYINANTAPSAQSFISTVTNTKNQNFFLTTNQGYEIHLKGYQPTSAKDYMEAIAQASAVKMDPNSTYCSEDGSVWGFKVPVRTKHVYEHERLIEAYLHFKEWCESEGERHKDWYSGNDHGTINCDDTKLSPWW